MDKSASLPNLDSQETELLVDRRRWAGRWLETLELSLRCVFLKFAGRITTPLDICTKPTHKKGFVDIVVIFLENQDLSSPMIRSLSTDFPGLIRYIICY